MGLASTVRGNEAGTGKDGAHRVQPLRQVDYAPEERSGRVGRGRRGWGGRVIFVPRLVRGLMPPAPAGGLGNLISQQHEQHQSCKNKGGGIRCADRKVIHPPPSHPRWGGALDIFPRRPAPPNSCDLKLECV